MELEELNFDVIVVGAGGSGLRATMGCAEKKLKTELLDLPNTILIPHMGSATVEGRIEMGEKVIVNIKTFIDGHNPPNRII